MKRLKLTRRRFIIGSLLAAPAALTAHACLIEPEWLKVRKLTLTNGRPSNRFVHFTDLHHKGDAAFTRSVVNRINSLSPDFVCFTGDLIEEKEFLPECLELLSGIKAPMFGVPGNHDYWSEGSFQDIATCFAANGGAWMLDETRTLSGGKIHLIGLSCTNASREIPATLDGARNIVLMHYPAWVKHVGTAAYDLMLAGHSHGGQVRIPFYGPIMVPFGVEEFDCGLFQTAAGPLYVNPGIGWFYLPVRLNCRPELTLIEI